MIHGIRLHNFGNHRDSRFEFGSITALVGRNGSGKTTVLRGVRELARLAAPAPARVSKELFTGPELKSSELLAENVRRGEATVGLSTSGPGSLSNVFGTWGFSAEGSLSEGQETGNVAAGLEWTWQEGARSEGSTYLPMVGPAKWASEGDSRAIFEKLRQKLSEEVEIGDEQIVTAITPVSHPSKQWLPEVLDCQYLHGVGINLHKPSYSPEIPPRLTSTGENLPSVISSLMTYEPERFELLSEAFRKLVPTVTRIRVRPAMVRKRERIVVTVNRKEVVTDEVKDYTGQELVFDMRSGKGVPAHVVSEGTLLILALLTIFHTSDAPRLVLIDDVEQALHPWAQRELVGHFRGLQKERPNLQLILTTHSPYIVDELQPEEVWMLAEDKTGTSVAKRLSEHPDLPRAKGILTTGEFWSSEGEAWLLDS